MRWTPTSASGCGVDCRPASVSGSPASVRLKPRSVNRADVVAVTEPSHIRQLEDAVITLWDWLPGDAALLLVEAMPRLGSFLAELDNRIAEEQPTSVNVWAEDR